MIIYKYLKAEYAESNLRRLEVWPMPAGSMNDPFELAPEIPVDSCTAEVARAFFTSPGAVEDGFQIEGRKMGFNSLESYQKWFTDTLDERVADIVKTAPARIEEMKPLFAHHFDRSFGLFCASESCDSVVMWSHYAEQHKGLVIGYDMGVYPFSDLYPKWAQRVNYDDRRAAFSMDWTKDKAGLFRGVALRKSSAWAYEREVRVIFPARLGCPFPVPAEAVSSVCFGVRTTADVQRRIMAILRNPKLAHVEIIQAKLNSKSFTLDFETIRAAKSPSEEGP